MKKQADEKEIKIQIGKINLNGNLTVPEKASGLVLFAHGSGSGRMSPRNRFVAEELNKKGLATLLFDLLTEEEEIEEQFTRHLRFDIDLLAERLSGATAWVKDQSELKTLSIGYFGASTGAAAALKAEVMHSGFIHAIVSRGGRPDLAGEALPKVKAPVLLIVGGNDHPVIEMNQEALELLGSKMKELKIVPGATHLFEESGALEEAARLAGEWLIRYLK